jgi:hypothetical protein
MDYAEANQRNFLEYWIQLMIADSPRSVGNGRLASASAVAKASTTVEA